MQTVAKLPSDALGVRVGGSSRNPIGSTETRTLDVASLRAGIGTPSARRPHQGERQRHTALGARATRGALGEERQRQTPAHGNVAEATRLAAGPHACLSLP